METKTLPHNHGNLPDILQHEMPSGQAFDTVSDIFKVLSDSKRVQIFWLLCHCEECVVNLSSLLNMSSPAVSHHLKMLKTSGFVVSRREGKEVYYTAGETTRAKILHEMIEQIIEVTCPMDETFADSQNYDSNIQTVTQIRDFLVENIKTRYTIDHLSEKFLINKTTLKATFKIVYGQPIASYMKEYRIKHAKEMLARTNCPISDIAVQIGYENQGKFTQTFKDITGMTPKDYRRQVQNK